MILSMQKIEPLPVNRTIVDTLAQGLKTFDIPGSRRSIVEVVSRSTDLWDDVLQVSVHDVIVHIDMVWMQGGWKIQGGKDGRRQGRGEWVFVWRGVSTHAG